MSNLQKNFQLFIQDKPSNVDFLSVVKCDAYGHGSQIVAQQAINAGAKYLGVACLSEALELRKKFTNFPIFIFGKRTESEIIDCVKNDFTIQVQEIMTVQKISNYAGTQSKIAKVHLKVDTGLGRFGVHWENASATLEQLAKFKNVQIEGIMTHFSQSDSSDKSYVNLQWQRFCKVLKELEQQQLLPKFVHTCNTCAYLDLPEMHCNMIRIGMLPLGIYPSDSCRKIESLKPVLSVKSKIAYIKNIAKNSFLGYGMHFQAKRDMRIAVIPIGYGDGYPRLKNQGEILVGGQRASIIGRNSMDSTIVDISHIKNVKQEDIVTLIGVDGSEFISVRDVARWSNYSTYQVLTLWTRRMERCFDVQV